MSNQGKVHFQNRKLRRQLKFKQHEHDFAIKAGRAIASERDQLDIRANTAEDALDNLSKENRGLKGSLKHLSEVRSELESTIDRLHSRIANADLRSKEHINYYRELYNTWMKTAGHHAKRHMCYKVASAALGAAFIISIAIKFVGV